MLESLKFGLIDLYLGNQGGAAGSGTGFQAGQVGQKLKGFLETDIAGQNGFMGGFGYALAAIGFVVMIIGFVLQRLNRSYGGPTWMVGLAVMIVGIIGATGYDWILKAIKGIVETIKGWFGV